jgi:DNA-binding transcriptional LysR family regulator
MDSTNLDMNLLRTFVAGHDLGSLAKAADSVGRSPSAVSLQLQKLERQVGQELLRKAGRRLELSDAGELFLGYARRILDLNDQTMDVMRGNAVQGHVRIGLPQDLSENWLPTVLSRFTRIHPDVKLEVQVESSAVLRKALDAGKLDLGLLWGLDEAPRAGDEEVARLPVRWIQSRNYVHRRDAPLPLVLFDNPCVFRARATEALEASGVPWRVVFTSPSLSGLWAAVGAGLGLTVRTSAGLPSGLIPYKPDGISSLGKMRLLLSKPRKGGGSAALKLGALLREEMASGSLASA